MKLAPSIGYGTKFTAWVFDEEAGDYRLQGFFGSVEISIKDFAFGMAEYDGEDFNFGIRLQPFTFVTITGFLNDRGYFGGMLRFAFFI